MDDPVVAAKAKRAAAWREAHEAELRHVADERRAEHEERRTANSAAWREARAEEYQTLLGAAAARRAAKSEQWAGRQLPINDPHVIAMADRMDKTPAEFLRWQRDTQQRLAQMEPVEVQMAKLVPLRHAATSDR